jgi:ribosome-associated toxin RatA of RatAB toxin-antitoxin module
LGIAIARAVSTSDTSISDVWRDKFFSFVKLLFRQVSSVPQKVRNIDSWVGFHFAVAITSMHKTNSIIICAPKMKVFEIAANLELWPRILPHYRYIRYLQHGPSRNIVVMAATRSGIPISWTSEQIIDRDRVEVRFLHLKAFTKGMRVVWTFQEAPAGVLVEIKHDLAFRVKILAPIADKIIGDFFIHHIANKTLRCMKSYVEANTDKVTA